MSRVRRMLTLFALTLAVVAFPLGVLASHDFADVPDSNPFHADISALVDAGVTFGCGGGNYCPSATVTREQMAAFLNRLGALAPGKTPVVNAAELDGLDSTQFVRGDTVRSLSYRCNVWDMLPAENYDYTIVGGVLAFPSTSGAIGCQVQLPDGATIVGGSFRVRDVDGAASIGGCGMSAFDADGAETDILATGATVMSAGFYTLTDTTVETGWATVNNDAYTYALGCYTTAASLGVGFVHFQVDVQVTGLPLP